MWPDTTETQELLKQAERDDPAAINRLLARHREALRRMIDLRMDPALGRKDEGRWTLNRGSVPKCQLPGGFA